jgi:hypothetical protein
VFAHDSSVVQVTSLLKKIDVLQQKGPWHVIFDWLIIRASKQDSSAAQVTLLLSKREPAQE